MALFLGGSVLVGGPPQARRCGGVICGWKVFPGVSTDAAHPGWLPVMRIAEGVTGAVAASAGSSAGRPIVDPLRVTRWADALTPELLLAVASGRVFGDGALELVRAEGNQTVFAKYGFSSLRLSGLTQSGDLSGVLKEDLTLTFGQFTVDTVKISVTRTQPQSRGTPGRSP